MFLLNPKSSCKVTYFDRIQIILIINHFNSILFHILRSNNDKFATVDLPLTFRKPRKENET